MNNFINKLKKIGDRSEKGVKIMPTNKVSGQYPVNLKIKEDINFGKYLIVETAISDNNINTTFDSGGRLGNMIFRNLVSHKMAELNSLNFKYERIEEINKLGIILFTSGNKTYSHTLVLTDEIIDDVLFKELIINNIVKNKNIIFRQHSYNPYNLLDYSWCQTKLIAKYIRETINTQRRNIISVNPYNLRFKTNNDLIVHVRLGDTVELKVNTYFEYYDKTLSTLKFDKGYITSDSLEHEYCLKLISKYNLTPVNLDEVKTIQFASVCKYVVLSSGTFSWVIGVFSFFSNVFYPKIKTKWHGDIFVFDDWTEVDY